MARHSMIRLLGAALVALPLAAVAQGGDERPSFGEVDQDGDGQIGLEEAKQAGVPESEFEREDVDDDGKLTEADWKFVQMDPEEGGDESS